MVQLTSLRDPLTLISQATTAPAGLLVGLLGTVAPSATAALILAGGQVVVPVPRDRAISLRAQADTLFVAARASGCVILLYGIEGPSTGMDIVLRAREDGICAVASRFRIADKSP